MGYENPLVMERLSGNKEATATEIKNQVKATYAQYEGDVARELTMAQKEPCELLAVT
jgi:hypothetical protein